MIIITGATGQLGRAIVTKLASKIAADQIGVSCRDPEKATDLAALGVRVRQGDFGEPESLRLAFAGATQVLLVSSNARAQGGDTLQQHRNVIAAAQAAKARRIVYTSQMAAGADSAFAPMHDHAATEAMLAESGLAWTALRHGFYSASALMMMGDAFASGELTTPADGKVAWTAHDDLAEAAATILAGPEDRYQGATPPLTGSEALDFGDLAALASELGKPITHTIVTEDDMRARMAARGAPTGMIELVLGLYCGARNGEWAKTDATLERIIGRKPLTMRELMRRKLTQ